MMRPLLSLALGLGLVFVGHTEAIAGRGAKRFVPGGLPTTPKVRGPHGVDGPAAYSDILDGIASFTVDCPEQCPLELQAIWQRQVDKARTQLGEDGFRASLQERGVNLDEFLSAERRADFVSVARIDYDGLYRSWPRAPRGNAQATRQWERDEQQEEEVVAREQKHFESSFVQICVFLLYVICLLLLGGVGFFVASFLWLAGRQLVALVCGT